jgi:hypothetical protein
MEKTLKELLYLDKNNLDSQSFDQPQLYWEWAQKWVNAVERRDKIKENIAIVTAEASAEIRKNPEKFGLAEDGKLTESFINSQLPIHPKVKDINNKLIEAQKDVNFFQSAKESIDRLGARLDTAAKLFTGGYFSTGKGKPFKDNAIDNAVQEQEDFLNSEPRRKPLLKKK